MSKNITIKEGAIGRNFTAKKLRTDVQGGGSCFWVPEDETRLITKRITAPGEYVAADEEVDSGEKPVYGYSKVTVSGVKPDADTKLITKRVTQNGTYKASDEPKQDGKHPYGYSTVYVNVAGGGTHTDPDTGDRVTPPASYDPGSSHVGTNPTTGNEEMSEINDNEEIITTELASYIQIDTPATKLEYVDGEKILLDGIVVRGYLKDGTPYKNGSMQDSIIPLHQWDDKPSPEHSDAFLPGGILINSPLYADISKVEGGGSVAYIEDTTGLDDYIVDNMPYSYFIGIESITQLDFVYANPFDNTYGGDGKGGPPFENISASSPVYCMAIQYTNTTNNRMRYVVFAASLEPFSCVSVHREAFGRACYRNKISSLKIVINKKVFYGSELAFTDTGKALSNIPFQTLEPINYLDLRQIAYVVLFGIKYKGGKQPITLTWPREGDRKHLTTTMEISVKENT